MDRIGEIKKDRIGWQSPIRIDYDGTEFQKLKRYEDEQETEVYKAVIRYGINVEKDELIRALKYDRQQYEAGFADGRKSVKIETAEEIDRLIARLEELKKEL